MLLKKGPSDSRKKKGKAMGGFSSVIHQELNR